MLFDFKEIPGKECYKLLVSTVTPRPIAWVVSQDAKGLLNAGALFVFQRVFGRPAGRRDRHRQLASRGRPRTAARTFAKPASSS